MPISTHVILWNFRHHVHGANTLRHPREQRAKGHDVGDIRHSVFTIVDGTAVRFLFEDGPGCGGELWFGNVAGVVGEIRGADHNQAVIDPIDAATVYVIMLTFDDALVFLRRRDHLTTGIQSLRQSEIRAPVVVPLAFVGDADMSTCHIAATECDVMLETLPHVQHQDQLRTMSVDVFNTLDEIIPCSWPLQTGVVVIGHKIVPVRSLVERQFDAGGRVENMHGGRTAFHSIQVVEPFSLCFT